MRKDMRWQMPRGSDAAEAACAPRLQARGKVPSPAQAPVASPCAPPRPHGSIGQMKYPSCVRLALGAALCLAGLHAPSAFAADQRTQAQAQVLDRAEFACDNCFFGARK